MIVAVPDGSGRTVNVRTNDPEYAARRAAEWAAENPPIERGAQLGEEDISATGDVLRGVGAGLVSAAEGISTLPFELAGSEEDAQQIRDFFAKYKPETSTELGKAARFIAQFAAPGGAAVKAAKALTAPGKIAATVAADIAATTPDVETLGDFFDAGPTKRIDTSDLDGAERAAANLSNRLRVGAEGAAIVLGVPAIAKLGAKSVGAGIEAIGRTDFAKEAARAIRDPETPFSSVGVKPDLEDPTFIQKNLERLGKVGRRFLTQQGSLPDRFTKQYDEMRLTQISAQNSAARQAVEKMENALTFVNKNEGLFNDQDKSQVLDTLNDFLFANTTGMKPGVKREVVQLNAEKKLKEIDQIIAQNTPKTLFGNRKDLSLFDGASDLREQIDGLSVSIRKIVEDGFHDEKVKKALVDTIGNNKTFYGMRLYRALKDANYSPTAEQADLAVKELVKSSEGLDQASKLNESEARELLNSMIQGNFNNAQMRPKDVADIPTLKGVSQGMLKDRRLDNLPAVRDFLGEYTGAKDVIGRVEPGLIRTRDVAEQELGLRTKMVETVDVMSKHIAKDEYYKNLMRYNNKLSDDAKFILDTIPPNARLGEYSRIGAEAGNPLGEITDAQKARFGPLAGKYVKNEYKAALEGGADIFDLSKGGIPLYSTFLGVKGLSQIAKTVYSPITQIRNATTAGFFALANGNVGGGKSLANSVSTIFSNLNQRLTGPGKANTTLAERQKYYNELVDLGVINTNAKIGEFESLLNDAAEGTGLGSGVGKRLFKRTQSLQNSFAAKLYQASDDVWKTYSYEMERGRLKNIVERNPNVAIPVSDPRNFTEFGPVIRPSELTPKQLQVAMKREAAEIVKDTVPNYARVPEAIKRLRQLPFGNFVAFPAEMIRTTGNILGRSIKELGSESPELREIGMKRLTGIISVNAAIPASLVTAGTLLTGANQDQIDAYKRSMAAEWDRNSTLIPLATDKNGKVTDFYNFSYTNPYDYVGRPAAAVFNAVNNGITKEEELSKIALNAATESTGEFFSPFMSESIITEKLFDLTRNRTTFNRPIYNETDPLGMKLGKSFAHLADGITPGFLPVDVTTSADSIAPGYLDVRMRDLPKAVASVVTGNEKLGVNRQGYRLDPAQEFTEALTGVKSIKPRTERVLYYRALEAARNVRDAAGIFNQVAKQRGNVDAETTTKAFITANEQRFKALRDLNMAIEDAKTLGLSTDEIIRPLREAKTPNLGMVMSGRFNAFFPSKETISLALRGNEDKLSNPLDFGALGEQFGKFQGAPFRPQAEAEAQAARAEALQPAPPPQPAPQTAPTQPSTSPTPPSAPQDLSLFQRAVQFLRQQEEEKLLGGS
jgi:DNA-binding transcriptional regulator YhcF (GntR family)